MDVVSNEGDHLGPVELMTDVLDCLCNTWVSCETVIMMGVKDILVDLQDV